MDKRHKVLHQLRACISHTGRCDLCPYDPGAGGDCLDDLFRAAIDVIEDQTPQPKKPRCWIVRTRPDGIKTVTCPVCGASLPRGDRGMLVQYFRFCPGCGERLRKES